MSNYKDSGVDIQAGYKSVKLMQPYIQKTFRPEVLTDIGGFGGLFAPNLKNIQDPVFVSGTDGVGTKLKIAFLMNQHHTIGIDCVAMCVNDIICSGAEPLFFLDYIAIEKNIPEKCVNIVKGITEGCLQSNCSLIGGETAEMPGFYAKNEYDLAGFAVGIVDREKIINGNKIQNGDKIIGLISSGLHSNGYSLVRKILDLNDEKINEFIQPLNTILGEELIRPTKIYVKMILDLIQKFEIKGIAHITGGGFIENIPRIIPDGLGISIKKGTWPILPIFNFLKEKGKLDEECLYNTFNMGIGMCLVVSSEITEKVINYLNFEKQEVYLIGEIIKSEQKIKLY